MDDDACGSNSLAIHTIDEERDEADPLDDAASAAAHATEPETPMRQLSTPGGSPSEWMQCTSSTGEHYYFHSATGETTWEAPAGFVAPAEERTLTDGEAPAATAAVAGPADCATSEPEVVAVEHHTPKARHSLQLVKRVMDGSLRRLDPHTQLQLEEARRRHRELEALRDEEVFMGGEHWIEICGGTDRTRTS
ncbi:hypothetical protein ATCC90586_011545 [Pythium insidiosum]|nr:hypothetical protein ATCC90586_011545 [Pythium insidiosum]